MFTVFLYLVVLLCFYWLNITVAVILLYWSHVSGCTLCWPFDQYSSLMLLYLCLYWLINLLNKKFFEFGIERHTYNV